MKLGEIIREKRRELSLTQEQLADLLGVSAPAVHKREKGTTYPDITTLPALARFLYDRITEDLEHSDEFAFFRGSPEYEQLRPLLKETANASE